MTTDSLCVCGHHRDWHSHHGTRDCEHDGDCKCAVFSTDDVLRWEPGSLSAVELDRVLTDALADVFRESWKTESTLDFQAREFRSRLEQAAANATGIHLCGLPFKYAGPPVSIPDASDENAPVPLAAVPATRDLARRAQGRFGDGAR